MTSPSQGPRSIMLKRRTLLSASALAAALTGVAACDRKGSGDATATATSACSAFSEYGTFSEHPTVTIATPYAGADAARFAASLEAFSACTGIKIIQKGSASIAKDLRAKVAAAKASASASATATASGKASKPTASASSAAAAMPDIAVVPQPGLVKELAQAGLLKTLPDSVNANIELGWDDSWASEGTVDGTPYGAPVTASVKSLVWYSPSAFKAAGYEVPKTWEDLGALTKQIIKDAGDDGPAPWCLGVEDGSASGWPLSDWLEDAMLATEGTGVYDDWTEHNTSLATSGAVSALKAAGSLLLADGAVPGGVKGALKASVAEAGKQLTSGKALMLHASSSFETLLPPGTVVTDSSGKNGVTVAPTSTASAGSSASPRSSASAGASASSTAGADFSAVSAFRLPSADGTDEDSAVLVAGDYLVASRNDAVTEAVMKYLTSADWATRRLALGGMATGYRGVDTSAATSAVTRMASDLLSSREAVTRFDGSDTMPAEVGSGSLWKALEEWAAGDLSAKKALEKADKSWPKD